MAFVHNGVNLVLRHDLVGITHRVYVPLDEKLLRILDLDGISRLGDLPLDLLDLIEQVVTLGFLLPARYSVGNFFANTSGLTTRGRFDSRFIITHLPSFIIPVAMARSINVSRSFDSFFISSAISRIRFSTL